MYVYVWATGREVYVPVHINELTTDVTAVDESTVAEQEETPAAWEKQRLIRAQLRRIDCDTARTRAEGFDD